MRRSEQKMVGYEKHWGRVWAANVDKCIECVPAHVRRVCKPLCLAVVRCWFGLFLSLVTFFAVCSLVPRVGMGLECLFLWQMILVFRREMKRDEQLRHPLIVTSLIAGWILALASINALFNMILGVIGSGLCVILAVYCSTPFLGL